MRIAVIGRTQMLYHAAVALAEAGHTIPLIVTAPAAPEYRKNEKDFEQLATRLKACYVLATSLRHADVGSAMNGLDIGVSVNWISLIGREHLDRFRIGILNAHMGDLPRYRGNACPNWAILNGEKEVTVSVHLMEETGVDCGRVITQAKYPLSDNAYIGDIYDWAETSVPSLFRDAVGILEKDPTFKIKYAEAGDPDSLRCYPRIPEDSRIDWTRAAIDIHRLIRASSEPFPGAFCSVDRGEKMVIWRAEIVDDGEKYCAVPGQIASVTERSFTVITGKGRLNVTRWDSPVAIRSIRQRLT